MRGYLRPPNGDIEGGVGSTGQELKTEGVPRGDTNTGITGVGMVVEARGASKTRVVTTGLFHISTDVREQEWDVCKKLLFKTLVCLLTTENDSA